MRTGLYPYNPDCESWTDAIETLGLAYDDNTKGKVQYEIYPMPQPNQLTDEEKRILRHDLDIAPENDITGDVGVAIT